VDTVDTNQPLSWAFQDAVAPRETLWTLGLGFTHQRSAVRYLRAGECYGYQVVGLSGLSMPYLGDGVVGRARGTWVVW
jgi:hypothetical protein